MVEDVDKTTVVVTVRCIDMANPSVDSDRVPCTDCGELTWISHNFRGQKIDKIICSKCFEKGYQNNDNYTACTKEQCIEDALDSLYNCGVKVTREEMIEVMEEKLGKKINIVP